MADIQQQLFDAENLAEARSATQTMVDNLRELNKLGGDFSGQWSREFLNNARSISSVFNEIMAKTEALNNLEVSKKEAVNLTNKLQSQTNSLAADNIALESKIDTVLKVRYDKVSSIVKSRQAEYQTAVANFGTTSKEADLAQDRLEKAEQNLDLAKHAYELALTTLDSTQAQIEANKKLIDQLVNYAENWDKATVAAGTVGKLIKGIAKIPILGDLFAANKAFIVMQKTIIETGSTSKGVFAGMKAGLQGLETASIILIAFKAIYEAFKLLFELMSGAQGMVVDIARNMGITRDSAKAVVERFEAIKNSSSNILANVKNLTEAQKDFTKEVGAGVIMSDDLLENQVFLTKNLNLSGQSASQLGMLFQVAGENSIKVTDEIIATNNAAAKTSGYLIPTATLMDKIAGAGAEIAGYFGFNAKSLAEAVRETTKFGVSLQQANTIAKGLLDFESSISNELEIELMTGKEFNFELARSKALQGDIAGASSEVLKQMQTLTAEQRKNPIIMEAAAKATGLSVEELNRAYLRQTQLNKSARDYVEELERAGKTEQAQIAERLGLQGASREQIEKTLKVQDAFAASLESAKESFANLVGSGALDALVDVIMDFVSTMRSFGFGKASSEQNLTENLAKAREKGTVTGTQATRLSNIAAERYSFFDSYGENSSADLAEAIAAGNVDLQKLTVSKGSEGMVATSANGRTYELTEEMVSLLRELNAGVRTPNNQVSQGQIAQAVAVNMGVYQRAVN